MGAPGKVSRPPGTGSVWHPYGKVYIYAGLAMAIYLMAN